MFVNLLTLLHAAMLLVFGITLTVAFADIRCTRKTVLIFGGVGLCSAALQLILYCTLSEDVVWKLYPLISHLPLILVLCFVFRKSFPTATAAPFTAYMCCQPAKWLGLLVMQLTGNLYLEYATRLVCLALVGYIALSWFSPFLAKIFNKDPRILSIFHIVPSCYYVYDYITAIYTDLRCSGNPMVMEFLPLFLLAMYVQFCLVYYREYEQKAAMEHKEQVIRIATQQHAREMASVKRSQQELRLLRHDMRLVLGNLTTMLEEGDLEQAKKLISGYADQVAKTEIHRYCENDLINYTLSHFASRCQAQAVTFHAAIDIDAVLPDELMLSSIISNALDNALNAQLELPEKGRCIHVTLKNSGGKLLFSVKNPYRRAPLFVDGVPVSSQKGHGYGTQSICYLTERLGGNYQFSIQDDVFILRIIL